MRIYRFFNALTPSERRSVCSLLAVSSRWSGHSMALRLSTSTSTMARVRVLHMPCVGSKCLVCKARSIPQLTKHTVGLGLTSAVHPRHQLQSARRLRPRRAPMSASPTCDECRTMLVHPTAEPRRLNESLARSPLLDETKRRDGVMVSLWRCTCGQLWQRERWPDEKQFWTPQAEPAPPPPSSSFRGPRF